MVNIKGNKLLKNIRTSTRIMITVLKQKYFLISLIKNIAFILRVQLKYRDKITFIDLQEHIGDIVACEPISRYIKQKFSNHKIIWIVKYPYSELVKYNPSIDYILEITSLFEWIVLKKSILHKNIIELHLDGKIDPIFKIKLSNPNKYNIGLTNYYNYGSLLESFSLAAELPKLSNAPLFHLSHPTKLFPAKKGIVIHCASNEIERNWDKGKWNLLANFILARGWSVTEIGLQNQIEITNNPLYLNYCGKKSLQEIAILIKNNFLFVGVDSGFAHIANALRVEGVILLGNYRDFKSYMPYTGFYTKEGGNGATIIHYEGKVKEIPVDLVMKNIVYRIERRTYK